MSECKHDGGFRYMDPGPLSDDIVMKVYNQCNQDVFGLEEIRNAPGIVETRLMTHEEAGILMEQMWNAPTLIAKLEAELADARRIAGDALDRAQRAMEERDRLKARLEEAGWALDAARQRQEETERRD